MSDEPISKQDREITAILSFGTCLEMFDLFLYIHMAVFLDKIFFPSHTTQGWILSNLAICSSFIFKPIGGLVIGWLGDKVGRTFIMFISTFTTGITCLAIAMMPSYSTIGISAAYLITICRVLQGILAPGEFYSAHIYIAESVKEPKHRYFLGVVLCIASWVGGKFFAIGLVTFTCFCMDNGSTYAWRAAFFIGGFIAFFGIYARRLLHETASFTEAKTIESHVQNIDENSVCKEKISKISIFYYSVLTIGNILFGLFPFTYCKDLLINIGCSANEISQQSLYAGTFYLINLILYLFLVKRFCPLKIIKYRSVLSMIMLIFLPYLIKNVTSRIDIFFLQCLVLTFSITCLPASPIIYKLFPILKRSRCIIIPNAFSSAIGFLFLNISIPVLSKYLFHYTFVVLALPIAILSIFSINHFQKLYKERLTCINFR